MTIIPILLIALLIIGTLAFVFSPLLEGIDEQWSRVNFRPGSQTEDELLARRDAIYAALKDAEFDRETGKLSDEDYNVVRSRYTAEAAEVLRQLDRLTPEAEKALDAQIERSVAGLRANGQAASAPEGYPPELVSAVEAEVASLIKHSAPGEKRGRACPNCGHSYSRDDSFCPACGASLADTCPQCGAPHAPDDAFCTRCGAALREGLRS